jgi:hypothetical protein
MPGAKHAGLGVRRNHDSLLRNINRLRSFLRADQVRELKYGNNRDAGGYGVRDGVPGLRASSAGEILR